MKNMGMGHDPRSIANAMLDLGEKHQIEITNLALNKIIFFIHSDSLFERGNRLSCVTFEAWQYGPVLPLIYHQFKKFGRNTVTERSTRLDKSTGDHVIADYDDLRDSLPFIEQKFLQYARLPASALVALSHEPGGAWDTVWNGHVDNVGMKITDDLIVGYNPRALQTGPHSHVRKH
ncbi:MAG: type II toxin-antitoxin system antitoxin SocA domain-containing protein [Pseudomonadota bacterium]